MPHLSGIIKTEYLFYAVSNTQEILINPEEHGSFRWITLEEIEQGAIHPCTLQAILAQEQQIQELLKLLK